MLVASALKQRALDVGFDLVGIATPSALKDLEYLPQWVKKGYHGEMRYLANPRREDPRRVLPSVKSILCLGLIYNAPYPYSSEITESPRTTGDENSDAKLTEDARSHAWISRYAWGKDYHQVMRKKLEQMRSILENAASGVETRVYVDTGPIVERAFARLSGIGWMGKNTCLINAARGSWFFLGVVLTNLELEFDLPAPDRCGSCTRCLEACPTGALVEPYVMDASRCISYFNIELRGIIPEKFRAAIGRNVFGCDVCQDVCPWNYRPVLEVSAMRTDSTGNDQVSGGVTAQRRAASTRQAEFQPAQIKIETCPNGVGATVSAHPGPQRSEVGTFSLFNPRLEDLAAITEEDFRSLFTRSPIKRAKYRGWLRNLCVVVGNSGDRKFIPWLENTAGHPDPVVREHASWAIRRLQGVECAETHHRVRSPSRLPGTSP